MSYYLLDNRNPNGDHFYTSRRKPLVGVIVHCTAGLEDQDMLGTDHSAEKTARYAATTERKVSWHSGSDSDSNIELLPPSYTAWHCRNYNSSTYGHEISKKDMSWGDEPKEWTDATLRRAATHLGKIARDYDIPIRKVSKSQLDRAIAAGDPRQGGFVGHMELDPSRRSDPGADFPWSRFINLMSSERKYSMVTYYKRGTVDGKAALAVHEARPQGVLTANLQEAKDALARGEKVYAIGGPAAKELPGATAIVGADALATLIKFAETAQSGY